MGRKREDLTGQKFGKWTVLREDENKYCKIKWVCVCDCNKNKEFRVFGDSLKSGKSKQCRKCQFNNQVISLTGQKFGRLTVIERAKNQNKNTMWFCTCECDLNKKVIVRGDHLKDGSTKSCGCLQKEMRSEHNKKYSTYDLTNKKYGIGYTPECDKFLFDLELYNKIKKYAWYVNCGGYVHTRINKKSMLLHRFVLDLYDDNQNNNSDNIVDHLNHELTDCRICNLRIVTNLENGRNHIIAKNNTSGVTGVTWDKKNQKWRSRITLNWEVKHLGYYDDFEDAVKVRKQAEDGYFKEFSYDNSMKKAKENKI